jgi:hypothetical protein
MIHKLKSLDKVGPPYLHLHDALDLLLAQGVEDDELIHAVDELWPEVSTYLHSIGRVK